MTSPHCDNSDDKAISTEHPFMSMMTITVTAQAEHPPGTKFDAAGNPIPPDDGGEK